MKRAKLLKAVKAEQKKASKYWFKIFYEKSPKKLLKIQLDTLIDENKPENQYVIKLKKKK